MDSLNTPVSKDSKTINMLSSQSLTNISPNINISSYQSRLDELKHNARNSFSCTTLQPSSKDGNVKNIDSIKKSDAAKNVEQVLRDMKVTVKPACDINGSLLALATKLRDAEFTVHRKCTNPSPPTSLQPRENVPLFVSRCLGTSGFGFIVKARKRAAEDDKYTIAVDNEINVKRYCLREETSTGVDRSNAEYLDFFDREQTNQKQVVPQSWMSNRAEIISKESSDAGRTPERRSGLSSDNSPPKKNDLPSDEFFENSIKVLKNLYVAMKQAMPDHFDAIPELPWVRGPALWPILSSARVADDVDICAYHDRNVDSFREQNHRFRHRTERYTSTLTDAQNDLIVEMGVANAIYSQRTVLANCVVAALRRLNLSGICAASAPASETSISSTLSTSKDHIGGGPSLSSSLRKFICDRCPYHTDNKSHLVRHKNSIHLTHRPYPCYVCLKPFSRAENVRAHFRSAHPLMTFNPDLVKMVRYLRHNNFSM